jgi:hypothetical protein
LHRFEIGSSIRSRVDFVDRATRQTQNTLTSRDENAFGLSPHRCSSGLLGPVKASDRREPKPVVGTGLAGFGELGGRRGGWGVGAQPTPQARKVFSDNSRSLVVGVATRGSGETGGIGKGWAKAHPLQLGSRIDVVYATTTVFRLTNSWMPRSANSRP